MNDQNSQWLDSSVSIPVELSTTTTALDVLLMIHHAIVGHHESLAQA
jgi:hypothetical protein